jgi:outer membrane protein W
MKNFLLFIVVFFAFSSFSQLSVFVTTGRIYQTDNASNLEKGGALTIKYNLTSKFRVGASFGYYTMKNNMNFSMNPYRFSTTPITGMIEYSFGKNDFKPYFSVEAGNYIFKLSDGDLDKPYTASKFGYAPTAGFDYKITDRFSINSNIKYIFIPEISNTRIQMNAGIGFKIY